MIVIPAIDLRDGCCVQLVGGSYAHEMVRLDDPVGVARRWENEGFRHLHIVDLDAAMQVGSNSEMVLAILRSVSCEVQVGGGIRTTEQVEELLREGAARVVVGTRALEEPDWLEELASRFPDSVIVAADVRDKQIVTRGWTKTLVGRVTDTIEDLNRHPLAGVMVTAVHKEGQMAGTDIQLMEDVVDASDHAVYASGGVSGLGDLHELAEHGVSATIVGMAIYTGALDARAALEEFGE